jgi:hypothetical protein
MGFEGDIRVTLSSYVPAVLVLHFGNKPFKGGLSLCSEDMQTKSALLI